VTRIAEAYLHLKPFEVSHELLPSLGEEVSGIAAGAAWELFDPNSEIEIRLEIGSLKIWATVFDMLFGSYHAVAEYPDFKHGAHEIAADAAEMIVHAKTYGDRVIQGFLKEKSVPPRNVYWTERRTMTPGKLYRLVKREERLAINGRHLSRADVEREKEAIEGLAFQVLDDLPPDQQTIVLDLLVRLNAPGEDHARRTEAAEKISPRLGQSPNHGTLQPELFNPGVIYHVPAENEFYNRFKLGEWHSKVGHLPHPSHDQPSSRPGILSPPRRVRAEKENGDA
jgi:hypothetical protein